MPQEKSFSQKENNRMKLEDFKAGVLHQRYQYKSFEPTHVNQEWYWEDAVINTLLEKATHAVGELNAFSQIVPDVDLFIEMHVVKEAQTSSKIEGTKTSFEEALLPEEELKPEKRDDAKEVRNYIQGINQAVNALAGLPLSNRMLKETHATLMSGVRGEYKCPGEFRSSQNSELKNNPCLDIFKSQIQMQVSERRTSNVEH